MKKEERGATGEVGDMVIFQDVMVVVQEGEGTAKIVLVVETGTVGEVEVEDVHSTTRAPLNGIDVIYSKHTTLSPAQLSSAQLRERHNNNNNVGLEIYISCSENYESPKSYLISHYKPRVDVV